MAAITAQVVNEFRKRTGLGLMECKALLQEADGDPKKAETLAKERGLKNAEKRAGRAATAGRVEALLAPEAKSGAIIELGCETDFVARNDDFRQAARDLAQHVLATGSAAPDQPYHKDPAKTIKDVLIELNARTGENVTLSRFARFVVEGEGRVDSYVHHDAKSGALVEAHGPADAALVKDLALQVVAAKPLFVRREDAPEAAVAEQRRIFEAQVADKPENVRSKIADGKLNAWYGEQALLEQPFVKDAARKVRDVAGKDVTVARFARYVVGEAEQE